MITNLGKIKKAYLLSEYYNKGTTKINKHIRKWIFVYNTNASKNYTTAFKKHIL